MRSKAPRAPRDPIEKVPAARTTHQACHTESLLELAKGEAHKAAALSKVKAVRNAADWLPQPVKLCACSQSLQVSLLGGAKRQPAS